MARFSGSVAVLLIASVIVSATSAENLIPKCCQDFHSWGENNECSPPFDPLCNSWCQNRCSGGFCKIKGGKHYCHCKCHDEA
ncbi:hypothetical protein BRADI_3g11072v3 [Brachypodium distachyon]|uniref:Knottin scorpion toxin-like domain-containing protein n=1 Tax=Brachypodium distachyon TaxID=15368 RepID=A0A0Q3PYM5_BRADI|nr:hypothetical protein BRADI_3g11072v3 [Brachypodium distachyon]